MPLDHARGAAWPTCDLVDCAVHVRVPALSALMPFLPERWRDYITESGVGNLEPRTYPAHPALESAEPDTDPLDRLRSRLLDPWRTAYALIVCSFGIDAIHNDDWAAAMASAVNDWQVAEWLAPEPRLRGSIVVPVQNPTLAAREIDRFGDDPRFVQVLLPVRSREPLGRRAYWPIYQAAQRHGLVVGVYAGGISGNPVTPVGWPSYHLEDYVDLAQAFQAQVMSLVSEGVFAKFPDLRVSLIEGGFTWLPALLWRFDKNWKGLRREVPWVDRLPSEIIRERVRLTIQPLDEPDDPCQLAAVVEQLGSEEMLLFATSYPDWHFDSGDQALPPGLPEPQQRRILGTNALETYRL